MKKTLILLIVAVVVVLGVILIPKSGNDVKMVSLPVLDLKAVDEVTLTKQGEVVLLKKDQKKDSKSSAVWSVVTKDYEYPANQGKVNALLGGFKSKNTAEWVSGSEVYDRFGLGEEKIVLIAKASGEEQLNLSVGNRGSRLKSYYLRVGDDKNVYQMGGNRSVFEGREKDFFNKELIELDPDLINKISFRFPSKGGKTKVLTKSIPPVKPVTESNQVAEPKLDIWKDEKEKVYDNKVIIDVQNTLSSLKVVGFDDRKPSDYSSEMLQVTMSADGKDYSVSVVEQKEDKTYVITTDDNRLSFVISELDGNRLLGLKDLKLKN